MNLPDFELTDQGIYADELHALNISRFHTLCTWVSQLEYGRASSRDDFTVLFTERKGTCSLKHGFLSVIADMNGHSEIELILGIYLLNADNCAPAAAVLQKYELKAIPEAHVYLRYQGERFDFTSQRSNELSFAPFVVREQRCEAGQLAEWKPNIHKHFMQGWIQRNQIGYTADELWDIREEVIRSLEKEKRF